MISGMFVSRCHAAKSRDVTMQHQPHSTYTYAGTALQYNLRSFLPRDLTSRKASLAAWSRQHKILVILIAASLCLAAILGMRSGSQAHQTQELQVCQTAVTVKVPQDQVPKLSPLVAADMDFQMLCSAEGSTGGAFISACGCCQDISAP